MRTIFLSCICCFFALLTTAQTEPVKGGTFSRTTLDNLEIKDSSGTVYPTDLVKRFLATGKYIVKVGADQKSGLLYRLTEEEINARMMNVRTPGSIKPTESNFFKVGQKIYSFKESDMNGNKYNLKELAGKVVVLNFWFINCPPCRQEIPQLNQLVENYKDNKDVVFIAVALDEKYAIQEFLKTTPFKYNIIDRGRYIAGMYNINLYPTHVVIDKAGKVVFHTSGLAPGTVPWIKKSIEAGLSGTELK